MASGSRPSASDSPQRRRSSRIEEHPISQQPGNSFKYLYERLHEKQFQQLCNALLVAEYPGIQCYPVGQPDGGRDASRKTAHGEHLIYQVKWSRTRLRDPVAWLSSAIAGEASNIERLVAHGATRYILVTNVAGTSARTGGTMDRLEARLRQYAVQFGVAVDCWWQADIDARVDNASNELRWTYSEMLAGPELVRYMLNADAKIQKEDGLLRIVRRVIAAQWVEDERVKFTEAELDAHYLVDLFVDVEARRVARATNVGTSPRAEPEDLGGASEYLLETVVPLTLVVGEPGQGKSTLGQYVCQVQRSAYLTATEFNSGRPSRSVGEPRLPLRVDLRDYAEWLNGRDPFTDVGVRVSRNMQSLEAFLAHLLSARSGGLTATADTVAELLERFPILVVLDGLDEVAQREVRGRVVKEIDGFATRLGASRYSPQLVVTTRPNASNLPQPTAERFETVTLKALSPHLRAAYLQKWAEAKQIRGRSRRVLQRAFDSRIAEPHIAQLADNPMQLTILLSLMHKRGESVPGARTELYTSFMETFLDREAAKSAAVRDHRRDLEEVTAYLGWYVECEAERMGTNGQLPRQLMRRVINDYLFQVGKNQTLVDDLFTAVTDRVWALVSKVGDTFEFDVQPVREYFAAKYLYAYAETSERFSRANVLRQLIRRPYWLNTARFYAGFASTNEISGLVDGVEDELQADVHPRQVRVGVWALLADGIFSQRPLTLDRACALLTDDLSVRLIIGDRGQSDFPRLPPGDDVAGAMSNALYARIREAPAARLNLERAALAAWLSPERRTFDQWWQPEIVSSIGTSLEGSWLSVGIPHQAAARLAESEVQRLRLDGLLGPEIAISAGTRPRPGSPLEIALLRAVLDGRCSESFISGASYVADVIRVTSPEYFIRKASDHAAPELANVGHRVDLDDAHRSNAFRRLRVRDNRFANVQQAQRFGRGQSDTTSPWSHTARAIADIFGACWLAAEIAIIGAAISESKWRTGGTTTQGSDPFGPNADYGRLLEEVRRNRTNALWWQGQYDRYDDELSRASWALALVTVASHSEVSASMERLDSGVGSLPKTLQRSLALASSRIGIARVARDLPLEILAGAGAKSTLTQLLLAHHTWEGVPQQLKPEVAAAMGGYGVAGWPGSVALGYQIHAIDRQTFSYISEHAESPGYLRVRPHVHGPIEKAYLRRAAEIPPNWLNDLERVASAQTQDRSLAAVADAADWASL